MHTPLSRVTAAVKTLTNSRRCLVRVGEKLRQSETRMTRSNSAISRTITRQLETRDRTDA